MSESSRDEFVTFEPMRSAQPKGSKSDQPDSKGELTHKEFKSLSDLQQLIDRAGIAEKTVVSQHVRALKLIDEHKRAFEDSQEKYQELKNEQVQAQRGVIKELEKHNETPMNEEQFEQIRQTVIRKYQAMQEISKNNLENERKLSEEKLINLKEEEQTAVVLKEQLAEIRKKKNDFESKLKQLMDGVNKIIDPWDERNIDFINKLSGNKIENLGFGKAWSIYKRIHQPNYVRNTVVAFGRNLKKKP